ncbi:MAG: polyprenyl glycosylphosphotransferase, partial [Mesorhizobium sp.]
MVYFPDGQLVNGFTNLNTSTINLPNQRHLLLRMRFQLLGGLTFAILLPAMVRMSFNQQVIWSTNMQATIFAAFVAHTLGYLLYKRIGNFPGVAAAGYILPTFALTYGLVFMAIFFFRFDYSRFQAAASFFQSTLWYFGLSLATRRLDPYRLAVIPGGDVDRLQSIPGVSWHRIHSPETIV